MFNKSLYLEKNVGTVDRVVRLVLGIALVTGPVIFRFSPWAVAILAAFGGTQIIEGVIAY